MRREFDFIRSLRERVGTQRAALGIGDDAAIINQNSKLQTVISTDLLVEDIDFRRRWLPSKTLARSLGHKALAVSLSDIAAMGATPRYCLTSIGLPRDVWRTNFADQFYDALLVLADRHGVTLIGGDTSQTPAHVIIDSILIGEVARNRAVLRSGAKVGDRIFVTGSLGGAAAGLSLLESATSKLKFNLTPDERTVRNSPRDALLRRQLMPTPRLAWGALLGERRLATAMIDLSDGLSSDLRQLCEASGVGALINHAHVPHNEAIAARPDAEHHSSLSSESTFALGGGEDYELLFTVSTSKLKRLPRELDGVHVTEIGGITPHADGIKLQQGGHARLLPALGFVHFQS